MASIVLFEDNDLARENVQQALQRTEHEIIGTADSLVSSYELLQKLALSETRVDYVLLDANLGVAAHRRDFRIPNASTVAPNQVAAKPKRWFKRGAAATPHDTEIIVPSEPPEATAGADGRQIARIIRTFSPQTIIINLSMDPAESWGGDVDDDMTKLNIFRLPEILATFESSANQG